MIEKGKISSSQFAILVTMFTIGSAAMLIPTLLTLEIKQDAWIGAVFGVIFGLLFVSLYSSLGKKNGEYTLVESCEKLLGKWIGKPLSFLYIFYFLSLTAALLRQLGDFMTTQIMPNTPLQAIILLATAVMIYGTRLGLESLARTAQLIFPWLILFFILIIIATMPNIDWQKIQPVYEHGTLSIMRAGYIFLGIPFLDFVIFLMIFPYVNDQSAAKKAFLTGTVVGGLIIVIITALSILIFGHYLTSVNFFAPYVLAKKITIGNFPARIEAVFGGIWLIGTIIKITVCFYASVLGFAQCLHFRDYRFLIMPFAIIAVVLSILMFPNIVFFYYVALNIWTSYSLVFGVFLPFLLLIISIFRKRV